tara:strand:- start:122 stop:508 length:387 start_codon:yes stop_codon:yes gene_type:complete
MANTYKLKIDQLYIRPTSKDSDGTDIVNVVTKVDYHYEATSPSGTIRRFDGVKLVEGRPEDQDYKAYEDITYEISQDWARHTDEEQINIYKILDSQITEAEDKIYLMPEKLPWESLPPGQEEVDAQNE